MCPVSQKKNHLVIFLLVLRQLPGAKWQLNELKINGAEEVVIMDFAEKYGCCFQNKVQSAFWDTKQVPIHPTMSNHKHKVGEEEQIKKHDVIGISNDQRRDAHSVHKFRATVHKKSKTTTPISNLSMRELMVQLASIRGMSVLLISVWKIDLMYNVTFETSHGKNVCDGLGSTVKNCCHQAGICGRSYWQFPGCLHILWRKTFPRQTWFKERICIHWCQECCDKHAQ